MAGCTVKERLIDTIKDEIKGKATSYTFEKERVFIPVSNVTKDKITSKNNAYKTGERIVNKLNLQYKPFTKSDIVSLDTTPKEGVYINIHPDSKVVAAYEYKELQEESGYYDKQVGQTTLFQKSNTSNKKPVNKFYLLGDSLNVKSFLEDILKDEKWTIKHSQLAKMAKVFLDNLHKNKTINVKFVDKLEENAEQSYTSGTNSILLDSESFEVSEERFIQSFIHEIGHSFTVNTLVNSKTEEDEKFKKEIFDIFQEAKKLKGDSASYGWTEKEVEGKGYPLEFISEFWTNPKFREEIRNLKSSFIDRILKVIGKLFGIQIKESDLFYRTEKVLSDYLENVKKVTTIGNLPITINQKAEDWNDNQGSAFEQQQRFFKRRIADLNKKLDKLAKYSKEWLELKKSINELELNVKEAIKNNSPEAYELLGKEFLLRVQEYISDLKSGEKVPHGNQMEYTIDVLDAWSNFPELKGEVWRLRGELHPFIKEYDKGLINNYATEGREITQEEIDKDHSDIRKLYNLGSRFLGSLSDSKNLYGRTIGAIIKEAQNEASTHTKIGREFEDGKKLIGRDELQKEVDLLYKYSISNGIKPINMYSIFQQTANGTTVLTQPFVNGVANENYNKIINTPELLRFYNVYKNNIELAQKEFIVKPGGNWIPNIPKTTIKKTLKDINPFKTRVIKEGEPITEEFLPDSVQVKYLQKLSPEEKSEDLGNILLDFIEHSNQYSEYSKALPKVRLLQEGIKYELKSGRLTDKMYRKGSSPTLSISGEKTDLYLMTEDIIKMQLLGKMKSEQGKITLSEIPNENGDLVQKVFDPTDLVDNLLKWNSMLRVGLSPITSAVNLGLGNLLNYTEAVGGQFFGVKELSQATKIFWKQNFNDESTFNKLLEELNPLMELDDYQDAGKFVEGYRMSKEKAQEYIYSMQKWGEKYIQSRTMLAVMLKEGYINPNGTTTEKWEKISKSDKTKLINKTQRLNQLLHGRYSNQEASTLHQHVWYRAMSQFRRWLPATFLEARFAAKQYDPRLAVDLEGRYITLGRVFFKPLIKGQLGSAFYSLFVPLLNQKAAIESGNYTESDIYNMRKNLTEIVIILGCFFLYSLIDGDDEEKRKSPAFKAGMTILNRISGDLSFFYNPKDFSNLVGTPAPVLKLVNDLLSLPGLLVDGLYNDSWRYKTGSRKNQIKIINKLERVIPGVKEIDTFGRILGKEQLEELR